ncbi:MAG: hypothetical protein LBN25_05205, partial [Christensenellaceae bacterium]|jgi:hypothetical protein|nr:hypothetical protein [Christensenellaceae bacterium]
MGLSFLLNNISQSIFNHSFTDIKTGNIEPGYLPTLRFGGTLTDGIIHSAYLQFINENNSLVCEVGVSDVSVTVGAKTVPAPATLNLNNIEETVFRFSDRFAVPDKGLTLRTDIYIHPNAAVIIPPRSSDIQITFEDMRLYGTITIETYQQMNKLGTIFFKYETDPSEPNPNLRKKLYIDMRQLGRNTDNNGNYIFNSGAFDIDRGGVYVMPLDLETLINSKIPFGSISGFLQNAEGYGMVADIVYEAILQYIAFPPKTSDGFNDVLMTLLYGLYDEYGLVNIAELMEETSAAVTNGQTISVSFGRLITLLNEQFGRVVVGGNDYKSDNFGALADSLYKDPLQFFAEYIYSYRNGGTLPSDPTEEYTKLMLIADLYTYFGVDLSEAKMVSLYGTGKDIDQMRRDYIFKLRIDISASIWVLGNFDGPGAVVRAYFDLNDNGILDDGEFIVYGNEFTIELYDRNEYLGNIAYSSARDNDYSSAVSVVDPLTGDISGLILLQLDIQRAITAFAEIPSQG